MQLYALSMYAYAPDRRIAEHFAGWCLGASEEEAIGMGLKAAMTERPQSEGWVNHSVAVCLIPEGSRRKP